MAKTVLTQTGAEVQSDLNLTENMFPEFSASVTYRGGNIVRHEDKIYRCIANTITGDWNSNSWEEITLNQISVKYYFASDVDNIASDVIAKLKVGDLVGNGEVFYQVFYVDEDSKYLMRFRYDESPATCTELSYLYDEEDGWYLDDTITYQLGGGTKIYQHMITFPNAMNTEYIRTFGRKLYFYSFDKDPIDFAGYDAGDFAEFYFDNFCRAFGFTCQDGNDSDDVATNFAVKMSDDRMDITVLYGTYHKLVMGLQDFDVFKDQMTDTVTPL